MPDCIPIFFNVKGYNCTTTLIVTSVIFLVAAVINMQQYQGEIINWLCFPFLFKYVSQ